MRRGYSLLAVLAATLLLAGHVAAEEGAGRSRIGLALSGGGARGAAHIGVIKVLEDLRVPVDYIAGTSMGAIVGGLYASGMTPDELQEALFSLDWNAAFRDDPLREDLSFRRKQDEDAFPVGLQFGYRDRGLTMPKGLLQGQNLTAILKELAMPVVHIGDFDDLPIPFRAVAADIETGEEVVVGEGSLAMAMRASMSIPGVFAPVERNGRLLVDGGIAVNLPVDVVRRMGADIVIAVDISTPPVGREKLQTALSITNQLTAFLTYRNTEIQIASLGANDILIQPDLGDISSGDFSAVGEAVPIGEIAARQAAARLGELKVPDEEFQTFLAARGRRMTIPPRIDFIRVESDTKLKEEVITSRLHTVQGETLDIETLQKDLERVYGLGIFERVDASVLREEGRSGLLIETARKSWGPNYIHFGLEMESDLDGGANFNLATRFNMTEVNSWGAEWRTDLRVGEDPLLSTEFYQPLGTFSNFFLAPRLELERFTASLFIDDEAVSNYRVSRRSIGLDLGREFGTWGEMRIGILRASGTAELRIGRPPSDAEGLFFDLDESDDLEFDSGAFIGRFRYDTLDSINFPRRGLKGDLELYFSQDYLGADHTFEKYSGRLSIAQTLGRNTLLILARGGTVRGGTAPLQDTLTLGGFLNLSGLERNQLRGQHLLMGGLGAYRQISGFSAAPPRLPVYLGFSLEVGNVWQDENEVDLDSLIAAGSVFLGIDTVLGPVYLAYGFAEEGREAFYFFLGRSF